MATEDTRDSQTWDGMAARWAVTHQLAVAAPQALANQVDAYDLGTRPAPRGRALDKATALWAQADRLRDGMVAFIRARFG